MNGTHRDPGVVFLSQAAELAGASLLDIAPTVLAVMGVQAPPPAVTVNSTVKPSFGLP